MLDGPRAIRDRRRLSVCAFAALALFACTSIDQGDAKGIKVVDSPVVAYPVAWMDNERILMRFSYGDSVTYPNGYRKAIFHWVSYNHTTGERHDYGRVGTRPCYRDGYVSHFMTDDKDDKQLIAVYGELGKETRRIVKPGDIWFEDGARGSCRPWSEHPKRPAWARGNSEILTLWPRLGVIDCQTRGA
ncbi:MAG TPA: hypothetical protein VLX30_11740, partial [Burkholderiales bacterium]|nr:hypothetical protein [Burkholderiales bacterium]